MLQDPGPKETPLKDAVEMSVRAVSTELILTFINRGLNFLKADVERIQKKELKSRPISKFYFQPIAALRIIKMNPNVAYGSPESQIMERYSKRQNNT